MGQKVIVSYILDTEEGNCAMVEGKEEPLPEDSVREVVLLLTCLIDSWVGQGKLLIHILKRVIKVMIT